MRGATWPDDHVELLRKAVLEKGMTIPDLLRLFPSKTEPSIRSQLRKQDLPVIHNEPPPDLDFFNNYGTPKLKVV